MRRQALMTPGLMTLAAILALGSASVFAQEGDLSGVTMRVLDDLRDVDAVVLELDANRSEEETAEGDAARDGEESREPAVRDEAAAEEERRELRNAREELHGDERGEGRLEDRDVERPAVPPTATP